MSKDIYIIHGWAYSIEPWSKTLNLLKQQGYNPIMLKVPGLTAPSKSLWTIDGYVEWLHAQIQDVDSPVIVGHSNGGRIALNYDVAYPGHIHKLLLVSSAGVVSGRAVLVKRRVLSVLSKVLAPLKKIPQLRKAVRRVSGAGDYAAAPENMKVTLQNMLGSDANLDIRATTAPLELIWGSADTVTPLWMAHSIQALRPGTKLYEIQGATHAPYKSHPELLADAITNALQVGS